MEGRKNSDQSRSRCSDFASDDGESSPKRTEKHPETANWETEDNNDEQEMIADEQGDCVLNNGGCAKEGKDDHKQRDNVNGTSTESGDTGAVKDGKVEGTKLATDKEKNENLNESHDYIELRKLSREKYEYFWNRKDVFSQWHPSEFEIDGRIFVYAEQYMMFQKAVIFGDNKRAKLIMTSGDPRAMKKHGQFAKGFNADLWINNCVHVVKEGNRAKFSQNKNLKKKLLETYPKILVEASPYDQIWGIGLDKNHPDSFKKETWKGLNLLGYILTEIRDEFLIENGFIDERGKQEVHLEDLTKQIKSKYKDSFNDFENLGSEEEK